MNDRVKTVNLLFSLYFSSFNIKNHISWSSEENLPSPFGPPFNSILTCNVKSLSILWEHFIFYFHKNLVFCVIAFWHFKLYVTWQTIALKYYEVFTNLTKMCHKATAKMIKDQILRTQILTSIKWLRTQFWASSTSPGLCNILRF